MNSSSYPRLLIVGASARAAAMSARSAGFRPLAADRFADLDLRLWAKILRVVDYPAGLEEAIAGAPDGPWMYTGALENRPELIERLSEKRELLGIGGESLRAVRDPFRLAEAITAAGLNAPKCASSADCVPRDRSWLQKPLASAAGHGIRGLIDEPTDDARYSRPPLTPDPSPARGEGRNCLHPQSPAPNPQAPTTSSLKLQASSLYYQQRIDGIPIGAVYIAANRRAELVGVTRQLIGCAWCGLSRDADEFRYCGSIGPLWCYRTLTDDLSQLGNILAAAFDLRGLFGVDAIIAEPRIIDESGAIAGQLWPVEVNPRYTASVEVLERALAIRTIDAHVAACRAEPFSASPSVQDAVGRSSCCGKAITFANETVTISREFTRWCQQQNLNRGWPQIADIPRAKTIVGSGEPVCTLLARGLDERAVLAKLKSLAGLAYRKIAKYGKCRQ